MITVGNLTFATFKHGTDVSSVLFDGPRTFNVDNQVVTEVSMGTLL